MFGYTQEELLNCFYGYPSKKYFIKGIMRFVVVSALPLLSEDEKREMDLLKQEYDHLLEKLLMEHDMEKEKTARKCLETVYQAVSLYDRSFDRLADRYFYEAYN